MCDLYSTNFFQSFFFIFFKIRAKSNLDNILGTEGVGYSIPFFYRNIFIYVPQEHTWVYIVGPQAIVLSPSHKRCHAFFFSLSHKRCHNSIFRKNYLSHEYKNYIFSLQLAHKTKPSKISCCSTSVTFFMGWREYNLRL